MPCSEVIGADKHYPILEWLGRKQINWHVSPFSRLSNSVNWYEMPHKENILSWEGRGLQALLLL